MKFVSTEGIYQRKGSRSVLPVLELEQAPEAGTLKQVNQQLQAQHKVAAAG